MRFISVSACYLLIAIFTGCSKDEGGPQVTTGFLQGTITDALTSLALPGVRIIIFNANTNAPTGSALTTAADGTYRVELNQGTYYLKLYKQGYEDLPPREVSPLPVGVPAGQTATYSVQMFRSSITNGGFISGTVTAGGSAVPGVLVIASDTVQGFSSVTATDGSYFIYNLVPGPYVVKAWIVGYSSNDDTVNVSANTETPNVNLSLTSGTTGVVTGQITFLATQNIEVDVSLTHPRTRETIPGLSGFTSAYRYTIGNVPNGTYLARATYANDGKVMDPDWIIKNGEPFVTVSGGSVARDFSVTGAVGLVSPTNPASSTQPVDVATAAPTLSWASYPSADDYVIEVINSSGRVIWGGFGNNWTVRNVLVPSSQTTAVFNFDTTATETLAVGKIYRWKIYASKDDNQEPLGWKLISASEDQRGLIRVVP